MKKIAALISVLALAGCSTTITTPDGWKYTNRGFNKNIGSLSLEQKGTNHFKLKAEGWKSDNQQMAEAWSALLQALGPIIARGAPLVAP